MLHDFYGVGELRQKIIKENPKEIYCQACQRYIKIIICFEMQGIKSCVGCQSPTRLCENCQRTTVAQPEFGLCQSCFDRALVKNEIGNIDLPLNIRFVLERIANVFNLKYEQLFKKISTREYVVARCLFVYILNHYHGFSLKKISVLLKIYYPTIEKYYKSITQRINKDTLDQAYQTIVGADEESFNESKINLKHLIIQKYSKQFAGGGNDKTKIQRK
jgi:hypothetical protein